jgi:membrane peptidoglycan carboxypeptidase
VEPASRTYFGKPARDLEPAEAATLAAMIRARQPRAIRERRDKILELMALTAPAPRRR